MNQICWFGYIVLIGIGVGWNMLSTGCKTLPPLSSGDKIKSTSDSEKTLLSPSHHVVKVHITAQAVNQHAPWLLKEVERRTGMAVCVGKNRFLLPNFLLRNARFIELEQLRSRRRSIANIVIQDHLANLALLEAQDSAFSEGMVPLKIGPPVTVNMQVTFWQFEQNDNWFTRSGEVKRVYMQEELRLQIKATIESFATLLMGSPILQGNQFVGMVIQVSSNQDTIVAIAPEFLQHFVEDASNPPYQGFPRVGFSYIPLTDPQLRQYSQLSDQEGGLFITFIHPAGAAAQSGLQPEDVVLAVDHYQVSNYGEFQHPLHGNLDLSALFLLSKVGQIHIFHIWRKGKKMEVPVTLTVMNPEHFSVPMVASDQLPPYMIIGGFIIRELSLSYLQEWDNWEFKAPPRLVYLARNQFSLLKPDEKIVFISGIIPTPSTIGYEQFHHKIITHLNGQPIKNIQDLFQASRRPLNINGMLLHVFQFRYPPQLAVVDARMAQQEWQFLKEKFNIPAPYRLK